MPLSDDLRHHGIKGQKWGVRRFQNEDGSLTAKGRKRYGEDRFKLHDDGKIEIEKGAELQRIIDGKMSKTDLKGPTYASIGKNDNNQYMNILAKDGVSKVLKLTAKTSLKSPSTNEAADMYFKVLRDNPKALKEFKGMKDYAESVGLINNFDKKLDDIVKGKSNSKDKSDFYLYANYLFVYNDQIPTSKSLFYQSLKDAGYNILRDEYDSRSGVVNAPMILLDGEASVSIKSANVVNKSMMKNAAKYVEKYEKKGEEWAKKHVGIT